MLVGGLAYSYHVEARATEDIDFALSVDDFNEVHSRLVKNGFHDARNVMQFAQVRIGRCSKPIGKDLLVVDFLLLFEDVFEEMFQRKVEILDEESGTKIPIICPEDLVRLKRLRNSPQDQVDIDNLIKLNLDQGLLDGEDLDR